MLSPLGMQMQKVYVMRDFMDSIYFCVVFLLGVLSLYVIYTIALQDIDE